jgi:hypothetical protein
MTWALLFVAAVAFAGAANGGLGGFLFAGVVAVAAVAGIVWADRAR